MDAKQLTQTIDAMPIEDVKTNFVELFTQALDIEQAEQEAESEQAK